jgi:long-chain acyl-CoA synthetase
LKLSEITFPSEKELAEKFASAIREINKRLPQYKIIRYFVLTYEDLVKTTTLKVKRSIEYERIKKALEQAGVDMRKATGKFIEKLWVHQ